MKVKHVKNDTVFSPTKRLKGSTFAKNLDRNIDRTIGKNLSSKYSQKPLGRAKQFPTDALNAASENSIQKPEEATSDLIENKIADKITKVLKKSQKK